MMTNPVARAIFSVCLSLALTLSNLSLLGAQEAQPHSAQDLAPESGTGINVTTTAHATRFMVAAANRHGVRAGVEILRAGGSAADALIAVQTTLNLVEPQSSGIGGGAFLLYWNAQTKTLHAYDGRETAPAGVTQDLFLDEKGQPLKFPDASVSGLSVGTPGVVRLLEAVHQHHGRLPWSRPFQPAIDLADAGFTISPRLAALLAGDRLALARDPATRAYFLDRDGNPLPVGTQRRNPELADSLRQIATQGADAFYRGPIATDIVAKVQTDPIRPGKLSLADLAGYQVREREPVCGPYRLFVVCGFGPPSSGGVAMLEILGLLSRFDLSAIAPGSAEAAHLISEASKLAFADRNQYLADPDAVSVPVNGLLDPLYLARRSLLIDRTHAAPTPVGAGVPGLRRAALATPPDAAELPSTSHIVIVDAEGNIASMTTSIENAFGSKLMVRGFLLNNQLTDFSFRPIDDAGMPVSNRVEPNKRPRSSMSPTIVFDREAKPVLAVGSSGGARIIGHVLKTLVGVLDWGLDIQSAISLPHILNRNATTELESAATAPALAAALTVLGHQVSTAEINSGLHGIQFMKTGQLIGGVDPRREGVAEGE
ncbi:gamma-glutamyltranspeptidase / glutathione hydrolase [uncultured Gammaproteobacteria bacterium]